MKIKKWRGGFKMLPTHEDVMLPLLRLVSDGKDWEMRDVIEKLAEHFRNDPKFKTTKEELLEILPSGQQKIFDNRVGWARTYLKKAKLLESPRRGVIKITDRGKELLNSNPQRVDNSFLMRYPEFVEFRQSSRSASREDNFVNTDNLSPEENIEKSFREYNEALISEILERLGKVPPDRFERIVVEVLVKMGYGGDFEDAVKVIGKPGDEGIDGVIKQDPLGLDEIYVQAKRHGGQIGRPLIQQFVGSLETRKSRKGIFITLSDFTKDAREYAETLQGKTVILISGRELAELMIKYNVGLNTKRTIELKRIDNDYFEGD